MEKPQVIQESQAGSHAPNRDVWLDVVRFAAIFLVLGSHLRDLPPDTETAISKMASLWKRGGWVGVDLFFVLSGYLVSGLLFSEIKARGSANTCRFLIRRGFKIYPSFYFALAFTFIWRLLFIDDSLSRTRLVGEVLFLQNYVGMYWQHHWSLAVEEHFYLLLALGVAVTQRLNRGHITLDAFRFLPWLWAIVAAICLVLRLHVSLTLPFDVHTHLIPTHLRIDSLLAGAVLAWYMHHHFPSFCPQRRTRWMLLTLGTALFLPPFLWDFSQIWWVLPFGALFHAFGASMIILAGRCRQKHVSSVERGVAWVGARSYNIYLWHMPWLLWINPLLCRQFGVSQNWVICAASYTVGAILIGILITQFIESPGLRIRDKLFPSLKPPLAPTT